MYVNMSVICFKFGRLYLSDVTAMSWPSSDVVGVVAGVVLCNVGQVIADSTISGIDTALPEHVLHVVGKRIYAIWLFV